MANRHERRKAKKLGLSVSPQFYTHRVLEYGGDEYRIGEDGKLPVTIPPGVEFIVRSHHMGAVLSDRMKMKETTK